jgi:hypothetical protein
LIHSNKDLGNDYIENDFMAPTNEEIRSARPLQTILPEDVLIRDVVLIATSICVGAEDDPLLIEVLDSAISSLHGWAASPPDVRIKAVDRMAYSYPYN